MKSIAFYPAFLFINFLLLSSTTFAKSTNFKEKEIPKIQKLEDIAINMFQSENMFFSGQPNLETLEWLKNQGVDLVINLRSKNENKDFSESAFNEKNAAIKFGMKYISIPISGNESYTKENLTKLGNALSSSYNKVLIHCRSCGRVSDFMIAYLVHYKGYELSEAIEFGKQMRFAFPLENLLDKKILWKTE